jgi:hypothetical protein
VKAFQFRDYGRQTLKPLCHQRLSIYDLGPVAKYLFENVQGVTMGGAPIASYA